MEPLGMVHIDACTADLQESNVSRRLRRQDHNPGESRVVDTGVTLETCERLAGPALSAEEIRTRSEGPRINGDPLTGEFVADATMKSHGRPRRLVSTGHPGLAIRSVGKVIANFLITQSAAHCQAFCFLCVVTSMPCLMSPSLHDLHTSFTSAGP